MRRPAALVASALLGVLLAGCGSGPSLPGAAAVVGDRVISNERVQEGLRVAAPDLQTALDQQAREGGGQVGAPVPTDLLVEQSRRVLTVAILHELVAEQSRRAGIVVPPDQVDARLAPLGGAQAAAAGSGFTPAQVRELVGDRIAVEQLGRRAFDTTSVTVDYVTLPSRAAADELARRLAADPAQGTAFTRLPGARATQVLRPGRATSPGGPASATSVVYGLPEGTVAVTPAGGSDSGRQQQRWTVVRVTDRTLTAAPAAGAVSGAAVDEETMIAFGLRLLQPLALELGVAVNPRYGAWDPTQLAVVGSPSQAGTVRPAALPAAP